MINRVVLVGRLTKEPEYRVTPSGVQVATFTLAINRTFTNQNGERQADFINCVVFRTPAENVNKYLNKGNLAGIEGRLQSRSYENNEGKRVYVTEVVCDSVQFLEPKSNNQQQSNYQPPQYNQQQGYQQQNYQQSNNYQQPQNNQYQAPQQQNNPFTNASGPIDINDDDLPF
ncbi:single-stranded DNA-binding protein [Mammaliicoccus sciuri]|uniref:single-stranded DNA-binding protein n=1 Tax=Mammaliicoccus sciuri TaxID=1296 RepID=UPI000734AEFD|nr:single-stranded DNA-binding protein [Mammaliicoccus sciuri]KTT86024.1 single-stranded DNA-binding protein [Mammaliicoccus sciuri]KTT90423.1 single-stranded DNA-binding protein [Mammaliicoccus sciuri]KTT91089.1 single-stranded DNA-binding protein [Mammaliicoccus sciuri]KTT94197.1 single-stranded DNA-binding protein [Mammaliicoccus sciuri]KTW14143.1 single-stranded DNA-binding protein [Mammaliicoccus sciuri]